MASHLIGIQWLGFNFWGHSELSILVAALRPATSGTFVETRAPLFLLQARGRTGDKYLCVPIQLLALPGVRPAISIKSIPTFDSDNLIGLGAETQQQLPHHSSALQRQGVRANLRARGVTKADDEDPGFIVFT
jgi:hypothetical protein